METRRVRNTDLYADCIRALTGRRRNRYCASVAVPVGVSPIYNIHQAHHLNRPVMQQHPGITPENYAPLENGPQSRLHNFRVGAAGPINLRPVFSAKFYPGNLSRPIILNKAKVNVVISSGECKVARTAATFAGVSHNLHTGCVSIAGSFAFVQEGTVVTREDETIAPFPELDCPATRTSTYSRHTHPVKPCTDFRLPDTCYDRTQQPQNPCISFAGPGRPADIINDSHLSRGRHPELLHTLFDFFEQLCVTLFVGGPFFSSAEPDYTSVKLLKFWQGGDGSYPYGPGRLFWTTPASADTIIPLRLFPSPARSAAVPIESERANLQTKATVGIAAPGGDFFRMNEIFVMITPKILAHSSSKPIWVDQKIRVRAAGGRKFRLPFLTRPIPRQLQVSPRHVFNVPDSTGACFLFFEFWFSHSILTWKTAPVFPNGNTTSHFLHLVSSTQNSPKGRFCVVSDLWQGVSGSFYNEPGRLFSNIPAPNAAAIIPIRLYPEIYAPLEPEPHRRLAYFRVGAADPITPRPVITTETGGTWVSQRDSSNNPTRPNLYSRLEPENFAVRFRFSRYSFQRPTNPGAAATNPLNSTTAGTELRLFTRQGQHDESHYCVAVRAAGSAAGAFMRCQPLRPHFSTHKLTSINFPRRMWNAAGPRGGFPAGSFPCEIASLRSSLRTEAAPFLRHATPKTIRHATSRPNLRLS